MLTNLSIWVSTPRRAVLRTPLRRRYRPLCEVEVNTETLLDLSKEVEMEIDANKMRHIKMSPH
jgi:hypothetical protein